MKGERWAKQVAIGRELMRKRMKSYLVPVAAVLFRARYTRAPQRVYFLWHPEAKPLPIGCAAMRD